MSDSPGGRHNNSSCYRGRIRHREVKQFVKVTQPGGAQGNLCTSKRP